MNQTIEGAEAYQNIFNYLHTRFRECHVGNHITKEREHRCFAPKGPPYKYTKKNRIEPGWPGLGGDMAALANFPNDTPRKL